MIPEASRSRAWLNATVWGMAITSFLSDLGHEAQTTLLPGFMMALGAALMLRGRPIAKAA